MRGQTGGAEFSLDHPTAWSELPRSNALRYFCPSCWQSLADPSHACPRCGTEPDRFFDEASLVDELLGAVRHPKPTTARHAVWVLGERRELTAIDVFGEIASSADLYMLLAVIDAAGKIGGEGAARLLNDLASHADPIAARAASEELRRLRPGCSETHREPATVCAEMRAQ